MTCCDIYEFSQDSLSWPVSFSPDRFWVTLPSSWISIFTYHTFEGDFVDNDIAYFKLRPSSSINGSVRPPVCLSHLFCYVPIIVLSWNFQDLLPLTEAMSMQHTKVKGQGHRGLNKFCPNLAFPDHNSSLNSQMATKWCTKLELP